MHYARAAGCWARGLEGVSIGTAAACQPHNGTLIRILLKLSQKRSKGFLCCGTIVINGEGGCEAAQVKWD